MVLTNREIYNFYESLNQAFFQCDDSFYLNAKLNFIITKNQHILKSAYNEIEQSRENIIRHYGVTNDVGNLEVPNDKIPTANKELAELLQVSQELALLSIPLSALESYSFTPKQMDALFFMIEED